MTEKTTNQLKLVIHVDEMDRWTEVASNLQNLLKDYQDAQVRVVANGTGVYAFIGASELRDKLAEQARAGVKFQVCANSMRRHGLDPATLPDFTQLVPAGIVALIQNQQEGFAYVKP